MGDGVLRVASRKDSRTNTTKTNMKNPIKLTLLAAVAATLGTTGAFADDQQTQNRLAMQRAQAEHSHQRTTIAVYGTHGVGRSNRAMNEHRSETRFELRSNAHGQQFGVFVPVK